MADSASGCGVLAHLVAEFDDEVKVLVGLDLTRQQIGSRPSGRLRERVHRGCPSPRQRQRGAERRIAVVQRMRQLVSDDRLLFLMELSIEPVLGVLKTERNDS